MQADTRIALIALSLTLSCFGGQTAQDSVQHYVGQLLILPHIGDRPKAKLKKSQLKRIKGSCDAAVFVEQAEWNAGTVTFRLQDIGIPSILKKQNSGCRLVQSEIVLELSGFAAGEQAGSLSESIRQVLQTPEEYLLSKGIRFSLPPGEDDERPVNPSPSIRYPKLLLRVNATYTRAATSAQLAGTVKMRLIVGTDGRAHKDHLIRGLGLGLDENAMKVLPMWRFEPALQEEKAVPVESKIEMHFDIQ